MTENVKYATVCLQGTSFRDYTFEEPETREQIISHFYELHCTDNNGEDLIPKKDFSLKMIMDFWEVDFERIKE